MKKIALVAALSLFAVSPSFAEEVVIHHDGDSATTSKTVETHVNGDGCASKTVHKENDAGDSKTIRKTNCD